MRGPNKLIWNEKTTVVQFVYKKLHILMGYLEPYSEWSCGKKNLAKKGARGHFGQVSQGVKNCQ